MGYEEKLVIPWDTEASCLSQGSLYTPGSHPKIWLGNEALEKPNQHALVQTYHDSLKLISKAIIVHASIPEQPE